MLFYRLLPAVGMLLISVLGVTLAAGEVVFDPKRICPPSGQAISGTLPAVEAENEAEWVICMPDSWNSDLVVYAHGTVSRSEPPGKISAIRHQLNINGTSIPALFTELNFAFAVVARSKTGLSVKEGIVELRELVDTFASRMGTPTFTHVVGVSQGSVIAAWLAEPVRNYRFDGVLAACGPIGDFRLQLGYLFDFLVSFEYFFRDQLSAEGIPLLEKDGNGAPHVPQFVLENWNEGQQYRRVILEMLAAPENATMLHRLFEVARVATDPTRERTDRAIAVELLDEIVLGVNDIVTTLGGNPYDNRRRFFTGSDNDTSLNFGADRILRFRADQRALDELDTHYETTGELAAPLVTLHNTRDHRVPFLQEGFYSLKVLRNDSGLLYSAVPVPRFGHCEFEPAEVLAAFARLFLKTQGSGLLNAERALPDAMSRARFRGLTQDLP